MWLSQVMSWEEGLGVVEKSVGEKGDEIGVVSSSESSLRAEVTLPRNVCPISNRHLQLIASNSNQAESLTDSTRGANTNLMK